MTAAIGLGRARDMRLRDLARFTTGTARQRPRRRLGIGGGLLLLLLVGSLLAMPQVATGANPSANLDQCANDPAPSPSSDGCNSSATQWVNGNLGASKALYFEGDTIPYRMRFD